MMKHIYRSIKTVLAPVFLFLLAWSLPASAVPLTAVEKIMTMPDGVQVTMWVLEDPFNPDQFPPVIEAPAGLPLTITLTNSLPEATSLIINGQVSTIDPTLVPTWTDNTTGPRTSPAQRVRSFTYETPAGEGPADYTWSALAPGTFLIQSGTQPSKQVPMGLYATLKVTVAADTAYPDPVISHNGLDQVLLFSEIDPELNASVTSLPATFTSSINYEPRYFLINGEPFSYGKSPVHAGVAGDTILLRFLNAGLTDREPVIEGSNMTVIAEDGREVLNYPATLSSLHLPAGKTKDVLITPSVNGYLPIYDRRLGLTNGMESPGGMLTYLEVGDPGTNTLTVSKIGNGTVSTISLPAGIECGVGCTTTPDTQAYLPGTELNLKAVPGPGSRIVQWNVGSNTTVCPPTSDTCLVTMNSPTSVVVTFDAALAILAPTAGEKIDAGSVYPITWSFPNTAVSSSLFYSPGLGQPFTPLALDLPATENQYHWTVPLDATTPTIGLLVYDSVGILGKDIVQAQVTPQGSVALIAPNSIDVLTSGQTFTILWQTDPLTPPVTAMALLYRLSPADPWTIIEVLDTNLGSKVWTVPTVTAPASSAQIGIALADASGTLIKSDITYNSFTIQPDISSPAPLTATTAATATTSVAELTASTSRSSSSGGTYTTLGNTDSLGTETATNADNPYVLLSPNGGEFIPADTPFTVLWQAPEETASFTLSYSLDEGKGWKALAEELTDTQFDWVIDAELGGNGAVLLKVTGFDEEGRKLGEDTTDEAFALE